MAELRELAAPREQPHDDGLPEVVPAVDRLVVERRVRSLRRRERAPLRGHDVDGSELVVRELDADVLQELRVGHVHQPPMRTVEAATTVPAGRSAGALAVSAVALARAAGVPVMGAGEAP